MQIDPGSIGAELFCRNIQKHLGFRSEEESLLPFASVWVGTFAGTERES